MNTPMPLVRGRWLTNESPARTITVKGRSAMNPDCFVGEVEGRNGYVWIYRTGYVPDLGRDVFAVPEGGGDCCPFVEAQAELRRAGLMKYAPAAPGEETGHG